MERMLVVVFDNEKKAYEGKSVLHQVERDGDVAIYGEAVVVKHADGSVSVKDWNDIQPFGTIVGTSLGTLIGLLGGPAGLAIGAAAGFAVGGFYDLDKVGVGEDFVRNVSESLTPNKVALIAQVEESWTTPVDTKMEAIGGTVFRRALWQVRDDVADKEIAAMNADLAQLREEMSRTRDERRAKLQKKIEQLQAAIDAQLQKAKERHAAFEALRKSKKKILEKNAAVAGRALKEVATTPL